MGGVSSKNVRFAFYAFNDLAEVNWVMESDTLREKIAGFDRHWSGKVTRTRDVVQPSQEI